MSNQPTTILDLSNGLGFDILYHPRIGRPLKKTTPFLKGFRRPRPSQKKIKKTLV